MKHKKKHTQFNDKDLYLQTNQTKHMNFSHLKHPLLPKGCKSILIL